MKNIWKRKCIIPYLLIITIVLIIIAVYNYKKMIFKSYENQIIEIKNNYDLNITNNNEVLKYLEASQYRRSYTEKELEQFNQSKLNEYIHIMFNTLLEVNLIDSIGYTKNATVIPDTKIGDIFCIEISVNNKKYLTVAYTQNFEQIYIYLDIKESNNLEDNTTKLNLDYIKEILKNYIGITNSISFENITKDENEYILIDKTNNLKVIYNCEWQIITVLQYGFTNITIKN